MKGKSNKLKDIDWKGWAELNVSILGRYECFTSCQRGASYNRSLKQDT